MSEYRAILVSPDARYPDSIVRVVSSDHLADGLPLERTAFDAAGDQPRIPWCAAHGRPAIRVLATGHRTIIDYLCDDSSAQSACRVVDAIVVPLEDAGATMAPASVS